MLVALFVRHFKTYLGINFIPVSNRDNFSAYVGENGIGKSSILEALDTYFNDAPWIINHSGRKRGYDLENTAFIAPIFALKKNLIRENRKTFPTIESIDRALRNEKSQKEYVGLKKLTEEFPSEEYYLICHSIYPNNVGDKHDHAIIPISNINSLFRKELQETEQDLKKNLKELNLFIKDQYDYIYMPVEINEADFTKLENKGMQKLISKELADEVSQSINATAITKEINTKLEEYLKSLHKKLQKYEYSRATGKHTNFTEKLLVENIIATYFSTKELFFVDSLLKKTPIRNLSAGEKRNAIISVTEALLNDGNSRNKNIIVAIDEPESSLYTKNCFEQFQKLKRIAEQSQVLITTHWYGFMPIVDLGQAHYLTFDKKGGSNINIDTLNLADHQREIKQLKSKSSQQSKLPYDTKLKSINDLVQSIVSSLMNEPPYNWILCEGRSDKIYLESLLGEDYIKQKNVIIVAMAGLPAVQKLYKHLYLATSEETDNIKGNIICLIDTDNPLPNFGCAPGNSKLKNVSFKRLMLDELTDTAKLIDVYSEQAQPTNETSIEDMLEPTAYLDTINHLSDSGLISLTYNIADKINKSASVSGTAMELTKREKEEIKDFFKNDNGDMKIFFAREYKENAKSKENSLAWIKELKILLEN